MIQAGDKKYIYNGNNKVVAIWQNGDIIAKFEYNIDGQIAKAIYGDKVEEFMWDGLALIWRSGVTYINEPYVTGGNPILSSKDGVMFNDMLGSTLNIGGKAVNMRFNGCKSGITCYIKDECTYIHKYKENRGNQNNANRSCRAQRPCAWDRGNGGNFGGCPM